MATKIHVFTFWEPSARIPGYIQACLKTWQTNIPDADIHVLDFSTIGQWIPPSELKKLIDPKIKMAQQADILRAELLYRHGGLWLDADTVVQRSFDHQNFFSDKNAVTMFNQVYEKFSDRRHSLSGAAIYAPEPGMPFLRAWTEQLPDRIREFSKFAHNPFLRLTKRPRWRIVRRWNFFLNGIIDDLIPSFLGQGLRILDMKSWNVFPELNANARPETDDPAVCYRDFYFSQTEDRPEFPTTRGLLLLHNSWSPPHYREMDEGAFMNANTRLSHLLTDALHTDGGYHA